MLFSNCAKCCLHMTRRCLWCKQLKFVEEAPIWENEEAIGKLHGSAAEKAVRQESRVTAPAEEV